MARVEGPRGSSIRFDDATSRLVLDAGGVRAGRMEVIANAPHEVVLVHPRVEPGQDPLVVAAALAAAGIRHAQELGVALVHLLLDDRNPHMDAFVAAAPAWGFAPDVVKALFVAPVDSLRLDAVRDPPPDAEFVPDDPETVEVFGRVLVSSITPSDRAADPRARLALYVDYARAQGGHHPEDWVVLRCGGRAAGIVFPGFAEFESLTATNLHVGVVPEFRGRGLGGVLLRRGIETMLRRGATRYAGSCDVANVPMVRLFERIACPRIAVRHMFVRHAGTALR